MNKKKVIDLISEQYSLLSSECRLELEQNAIIRNLDRNTILVKEGQYSDKAFYVVSGCARAYYLRDGKDISDWFAFENDFISSINSFFLQVPSPHFIEVLEPSIILEISRDTVEELSDRYRDFDRLSKVIVTKTMLQQRERMYAMQFQTAEQKYESIVANHPNIAQRVSLTDIASYIGITLETLSRIRKPKSRI